MRVLGALVVALIMYVAVPLLWQLAMMHKVRETVAAEPVPVMQPVEFNYDANLTMNAINPPIEINTEEYEAIAVQSQTDQAMRQAQIAQDQAWQATH